ncbi:hypothetical protein QBC44DRAFT_312007 [Cladorrhinum sp. PSN332]|nr:hypothetical protein QBC44DRAFT_312007 [Cladorrhinum sp. PSN332]
MMPSQTQGLCACSETSWATCYTYCENTVDVITDRPSFCQSCIRYGFCYRGGVDPVSGQQLPRARRQLWMSEDVKWDEGINPVTGLPHPPDYVPPPRNSTWDLARTLGIGQPYPLKDGKFDLDAGFCAGQSFAPHDAGSKSKEAEPTSCKAGGSSVCTRKCNERPRDRICLDCWNNITCNSESGSCGFKHDGLLIFNLKTQMVYEFKQGIQGWALTTFLNIYLPSSEAPPRLDPASTDPRLSLPQRPSQYSDISAYPTNRARAFSNIH